MNKVFSSMTKSQYQWLYRQIRLSHTEKHPAMKDHYQKSLKVFPQSVIRVLEDAYIGKDFMDEYPHTITQYAFWAIKTIEGAKANPEAHEKTCKAYYKGLNTTQGRI